MTSFFVTERPWTLAWRIRWIWLPYAHLYLEGTLIFKHGYKRILKIRYGCKIYSDKLTSCIFWWKVIAEKPCNGGSAFHNSITGWCNEVGLIQGGWVDVRRLGWCKEALTRDHRFLSVSTNGTKWKLQKRTLNWDAWPPSNITYNILSEGLMRILVPSLGTWWCDITAFS